MGQKESHDWSIHYPLPCSCADCKIVMLFLTSKTETKKVWPIAKVRRKHIMNVFYELDLPVNISEESSGSPYK